MASGDRSGNRGIQAIAGTLKMRGTAMYSAKKKVWSFSKMDLLAFAVVAVVFAPLIWWITDRTPPVRFIEYGIFPPTVRPGETIYRVIKVERFRICETDPDTVIVDGARVRWNYEEPPLISPGPLGFDEYRRPVVIPLQASPGVAEMRTSATYVCNPVHRIWPIRVIGEPLRFNISAP